MKELNNIKRTVCNIGYKHSMLTTEPNGSRKPYSIWKNMLYRCYSENDSKYRFYGGRGVYVSDEWHCYDTFRRDIECLDGYDEKLFYNNMLELDKDFIQKDNKVYSKETCRWASREENMSIVKKAKFQPHLTTVKIVALDPNDEIHCVINIPLFAECMTLDKSRIYQTLTKKGSKSYKGWCFKKVVDFNKVNEISRSEFKQTRHGCKPTKYKVVDCSGEVFIFESVKYASEFLGCSTSLLTQRTRDGKEYSLKDYKISRLK